MDTRERGNGTLFWQNNTLKPLGDLRQGMLAVAVVSIISFVTTAALLFYLLFKLLTDSDCCRRRQRRQRPAETQSEISLDLSLSTPAQRHLEGAGQDNNPVSRSQSTRSGSNNDYITNQAQDAHRASSAKEPIRNPFPFLIISILGAECYTTLGFSLNLVWVLRDGIFVGTPACSLQGWLNSMGILYSSIAYMSMATSNYLAIVWGFRARNRTIIITNLGGWLLTMGLVAGGIIAGKNGEEFGGWYVRANAWVLLDKPQIHSGAPLVLLGVGTVLDPLYLLPLRADILENMAPEALPPTSPRQSCRLHGWRHEPSLGLPPGLLRIPVRVHRLHDPLAIIRLKQSMNENEGERDNNSEKGTMNPAYYYVAALMVSSNGLWNTILWLTTMFVSTPEDIRHAGLGTFAFMRTPEWRKFGNMVWISGPMSKKAVAKAGRGRGIGDRRHGSDNNDGSWWWWRMGGETRLRNSGSATQGPSQEFLHLEESGIQMDVVTTITVEEAAADRDKDVGAQGRLSHKHDQHDDTDSN
ncbi:hypothetical protein PG993_009793 [Apiospora rasikravindrae]|uniref:Uncharacterized protein n=1 Tax=Apiospora rasikravindrae TaxID=990691 RepID=A0ABR1SKE3_9PEZI